MFVAPSDKRKLLSLPETFVRMLDVSSDGGVTLELTYNVKHADAMNEKATAVKVSIITKHVPPPQMLANTVVGAYNTKGMISSILSLSSAAKTAAKQQETYVAATTMSDVTAKISNSMAPRLAAGLSAPQPPKTVLTTVAVDALKLLNDERPTLQSMVMSPVTGSTNVTADILRMIMRDGIDPSNVGALTSRSITPLDATSGFGRKHMASEIVTSPISRYHSFLVGDTQPASTTHAVSPTSQIQTIEVIEATDIDVPVRVHIPGAALVVDGTRTATVFAKFELVRASDGTIVDSVTRDIDLARHVQVFMTPKVAPYVKVTKSDISSKANIEVKQRDEIATAVRIYTKKIYRSSPDFDDYTFFGEYKLSAADQTLLVQVDVPVNAVAVYRVIPVNDRNIMGFEYANVIVKPSKYYPIKHVSLVTQAVDVGFKLEIRGVPHDVVAVQAMKADKTRHEQVPVTFGDNLLISDGAAASTYLTIVDMDVKDGHVYEYACKLTYANGNTEISGNTVVEYVKLNDSLVDTKIAGLNVSHLSNEPNVTFNVATSVLDSDISSVKKMLEQQNLIQYFTDDVLNERDKLAQLIAHGITRVDLTSGQREDFGVITSGSFSDLDLRKNTSVSPLQYGHRYRYDVAVLLRAPETMFEGFVKTAVDPTSNRSYTFKPSKFLHPITLTAGNIVSPASLQVLYPKSAMSHGQIGTLTSVDVTFDLPPAKIVDAKATRFDARHNVLSWHVQGSIDRVEHFVIMKLVNGMRTIVGKAHSEFESGNCTFIHTLTSGDGGPVSYLIVPIFDNYSVGETTPTNVVVI